jgi:hypothetical protein
MLLTMVCCNKHGYYFGRCEKSCVLKYSSEIRLGPKIENKRSKWVRVFPPLRLMTETDGRSETSCSGKCKDYEQCSK